MSRKIASTPLPHVFTTLDLRRSNQSADRFPFERRSLHEMWAMRTEYKTSQCRVRLLLVYTMPPKEENVLRVCAVSRYVSLTSVRRNKILNQNAAPLCLGELDEWQQAVSKYLNGVGPTGPAVLLLFSSESIVLARRLVFVVQSPFR